MTGLPCEGLTGAGVEPGTWSQKETAEPPTKGVLHRAFCALHFFVLCCVCTGGCIGGMSVLRGTY